MKPTHIDIQAYIHALDLTFAQLGLYTCFDMSPDISSVNSPR
jgi:hypothetical protein